MDISEFKKLPIMAIVRGLNIEIIEPIIETACLSGLKAIEFTMNTPDAANLIRKAVSVSKGRIAIGAGTVLSIESMRLALDSGATFIVSPCLIEEVVKYCARHLIPVFPGALSPKEVFTASECGASMVKIFPANRFGPQYFKELKGPFDKIELLACGGVTPENIKSYFVSGASAVAFGNSIFKRDYLMAGDFAKIADAIKKLIIAKE